MVECPIPPEKTKEQFASSAALQASMSRFKNGISGVNHQIDWLSAKLWHNSERQKCRYCIDGMNIVLRFQEVIELRHLVLFSSRKAPLNRT